MDHYEELEDEAGDESENVLLALFASAMHY